ncbi:MAG: class I SAM-dependent methyltransferase [Elusimicrobiales bacterium]|nr:class I SAM-dependent methyltransferase [Elusimicrobiales bacterium]
MTLARKLENEVIDSGADALEYSSIDRARAGEGFAAALRELSCRGGNVLDLGGGAGDISAAVCRGIPLARVTVLDLSAEMLRLAAARARQEGLEARMTFLRADARSTGLPARSFDFIITNNFLHHLPDPFPAFLEIARLCRPGGGLLLRDLRRPDTLEQAQAHAGRSPDASPRQRQLLLDSLQAALRPEEAHACAMRAGLNGYTLGLAAPIHWELRRPAAPGAAVP